MNELQIEHIAVVGAGTMGSGIAQVAACSGKNVTLIDLGVERLEQARQVIATSLERLVKKDKLTAEAAGEALARIRFESESNHVTNAGLIVEAVFERYEVKREIWRKLDTYARPETIFATNTSSISVTRLASETQRPERFIGMHFFNPVPLMKLVEVIRGNKTSDETCANVIALCRALDKTPVEVNDYPGFVSNRVLMPLLNEAMFAVYEGVATPEAIDDVFKLGMAHPMGPLALADFIGLDVCLDIMQVLLDGFNDPKYRPCPLLKQMVAAGKLGRKSGEGFYRYR